MDERFPGAGSLDLEPPAQTLLQRQLRAGPPARRITALDAFTLAKRWFLRGEWVGTREQLLVEVLWSLAERTLSDELKRVEAEDPAGSRVAGLLSRFVRDCLSNPGMRQLQRDEGALAFRLLTLARYGFHPRFVKLVRDILAQDAAAGRLEAAVPLDDLAYTAVRVVESYVHRAAITGEEPDADRAARVLHALLR